MRLPARVLALLMPLGLLLTLAVPSSAAAAKPKLRVFLAVAPQAFSPNGDGVKDLATIWVKLSEPAALELDVVDSHGNTVHRIATGRKEPAGKTEFTWGGLVGAGGHWHKAPDGVYHLRARATDTAKSTASARGWVRVDTTPPAVEWRGVSPEPASGQGPITLAFSSADPGGQVTVTASLWNRFRPVASLARTSKPTGQATVAIRPQSVPPPGLYRARLSATDVAGNTFVTAFEPLRIIHPVTTAVIHSFTGVGDRVALTFDDCIYGGAWGSILNTLDRFGVKATFFCNAIRVAQNVAVARRAVADGMTVGSHTRDHADLTKLSESQIRSEIEADVTEWWNVARATPIPYFRPPYGAYNSTVLRVAGELGFSHTMLWDVDPQDWSDPGVGEIVKRVLSHAHAGMVVVMHVKSQTAAALPAILSGLHDRNLQQVSLDQMFAAAAG